MDEHNSTNQTNIVRMWLYFISYDILLPTYLVVGLAGNIVLLVAFYKQSKVEHTYIYQVLLTVSKTMEVITFGGYQLGTDLFSGVYEQKAEWFQRSYFLMFLTLKVGAVLHYHFIISSLLLATAMAADRVFALSLPARYNKARHGVHQAVAAVVCFTVPCAASISLAWLFDIVPEDGHYVGVQNRHHTFEAIGSAIGMFLRLSCLGVLIALNAVMIGFFRKRQKKIGPMISGSKLAEVRKAADKTILLLNVWQSVLMCINQIPHVSLHFMMFITPNLQNSFVTTLAPAVDALVFITDSVDLAVVMSINKKMRRIVRRAVKCCQEQDQSVIPTVVRTGIA